MAKKERFVGLLSNIDDELVGAELCPGVTIQKWPVRKLVRYLQEFGWVPDPHLESYLDDHYYALDEAREHGYVVAAEFSPPRTKTIDSAVADRAKESFVAQIEGRLKLLRLFEEGALNMPMWCFYEFENRRPSSTFMSWDPAQAKYLPYRWCWGPEALRVCLQLWTLPLSPAYVQLAFDTFDDAYEAHNLRTEFLTLMIAAEVLFNMGPQELRYRVSRSMAVVLGETKADAERIFARMKKMYDKRSHLVHTGTAELTENDIWWLRQCVRRAIVTLAELNLPKTELGKRLDGAGFGQRARYLGYNPRHQLGRGLLPIPAPQHSVAADEGPRISALSDTSVLAPRG